MKPALLKAAVCLTLALLAPNITFAQVTGGPTSQLVPNPYLDSGSQAANLLNESLAHINESYRGVHQCFGDDLVCKSLERLKPEGKTVATVTREYVCSALDRLPPDFDVTLNSSAGPVQLKDGSLRDFCRSYSR